MRKIYEIDIMLDGTKLRRLRKEHSFTQETLAEMVGITRRHLSDLERGKKNNTLLSNSKKLSMALYVAIDELIVEVYKKAE